MCGGGGGRDGVRNFCWSVIYSIVLKRHKESGNQVNGDYCLVKSVISNGFVEDNLICIFIIVFQLLSSCLYHFSHLVFSYIFQTKRL